MRDCDLLINRVIQGEGLYVCNMHNIARNTSLSALHLCKAGQVAGLLQENQQ
jgi:hypothetical protein